MPPPNEPLSVASFLLGAPGLAPRRVRIDRPALTIGRDARNHVMLDDPSVSDEHAVVRTGGARSIIQDLGSRYGTLVNGRPVGRHALADGDVIDIGVYRLAYAAARTQRPPGAADGTAGAARAGVVPAAAAIPGTARRPGIGPIVSAGAARLDVLAGAHAGRDIVLDRPINRVGGPDGQLAVVSSRREGWSITHLEGPGCPLLNGAPIGLGAYPLADGDLIELAGAMLRFRLGR